MEHFEEGKGLKALTSDQEFSRNEIIIISIPPQFRSPNEPTFQLASCLFNQKKPEINLPANKILKNIQLHYSCTTQTAGKNNNVAEEISAPAQEKQSSTLMNAPKNPNSSLQPLSTDSLFPLPSPKIHVSDPWNRNRRFQHKTPNGFSLSNNRILTGDNIYSTRNTSEADFRQMNTSEFDCRPTGTLETDFDFRPISTIETDFRPIGTLATDFRPMSNPHQKARYHQYHPDTRGQRGNFLNKRNAMRWNERNNVLVLPEHVFSRNYDLAHAKHLIFVSMREIGSFFFYLRRTLPTGIHIWVTHPPGFQLRGLHRTNIQSLIQQKCFHIHPLAGTSKYEAVICFPPLMYELDENLPKSIPYTIIVRKEMNKTVESLRNSGRTINLMACPTHHRRATLVPTSFIKLAKGSSNVINPTCKAYSHKIYAFTCNQGEKKKPENILLVTYFL